MTHADWTSRAVAPADAVAAITSGMRCFVHGGAATPTPLLEALAARTDLRGVTLHHLHLEGPVAFAEPERAEQFRSVSYFVGANLRAAVNDGRADYVPIFLSEVPALLSAPRPRLDVAIVQVSPPDRHGFCTLGTSVDTARAAVDHAQFVIAEVNERMPRTHGNTLLPFSRIAHFIHTDRPLPEASPRPETPEIARIAEQVAQLVEDGATLQMGIGAIPDAVLARLGDRQDLGIHTEMFSDRLVDLVRTGAVTNRHKAVFNGRILTSFVLGSSKTYDFVDDNPMVEFHPCDRTNDPAQIQRNPRVVAINSALQVDLTGQVCADSVGTRIYSGIGGQMDFLRGAARSPGGRPIIAMPSTARGGTLSRIVPTLLEGAGVVTSRGHVHWVITEYGAVTLHGASLRERAARLIGIAHPDHREALRQAAVARKVIPVG
jgi:acyl-CoA hydrolase